MKYILLNCPGSSISELGSVNFDFNVFRALHADLLWTHVTFLTIDQKDGETSCPECLTDLAVAFVFGVRDAVKYYFTLISYPQNLLKNWPEEGKELPSLFCNFFVDIKYLLRPKTLSLDLFTAMVHF